MKIWDRYKAWRQAKKLVGVGEMTTVSELRETLQTYPGYLPVFVKMSQPGEPLAFGFRELSVRLTDTGVGTEAVLLQLEGESV